MKWDSQEDVSVEGKKQSSGKEILFTSFIKLSEQRAQTK
jgi:hypothetical protein